MIMGARKDLSDSFSRLTQEEVEAFCMEWDIGLKFNPVAPGCDKSVDQCPSGSIALYCRHFEFSNLHHPFSTFLLNVLEYSPASCRFFILGHHSNHQSHELQNHGSLLVFKTSLDTWSDL
ncbi:hypothetical protein Hanom_Chr09g00775291 [Helianthus anomalus]